MFADLKLENIEDIHKWSNGDVEKYKQEKRKNYKIQIEEYLLDENNTLDADIIASKLFPQVEADIFISHSHSDEDKAIKLALSLEEIGLATFVDSCVWGYSDELLKKIDDKFCIPEGWSHYSYPLRNRTTTNVHMILNSALHEMIDRSELFIFLESENSVKIDDYINKSEYLSSPWIFSELAFAKRVQRKERRRISPIPSLEDNKLLESTSRDSDVAFAYKVPELVHKITFSEFQDWMNKGPTNQKLGDSIDALNHLDQLYRTIGIDPIRMDTSR